MSYGIDYASAVRHIDSSVSREGPTAWSEYFDNHYPPSRHGAAFACYVFGLRHPPVMHRPLSSSWFTSYVHRVQWGAMIGSEHSSELGASADTPT